MDFFGDFVQKAAMEHANACNLADGGEPESKGLMYALFCVLKKISTNRPSWYCYVTGTSLSVATFQSDIDGISVARGSMVPVSPDSLLSVDDTVSLLTHYFRFADGVISLLREKLSLLQGRPQCFAKGVFEPLVSGLPRQTRTRAMFDGFSWIDFSFETLFN